MSNAYFTKTGAELRALAGTNDAAAIAEIARRASKPAKTVAALKSRGDIAAAQARIDAAAKPAPKAKAEPKAITPIKPIANAPKAVAFTKTHERIEAPKGAIAHLHNRLCNVEQAILKLAETQAEVGALLKRIAK